jgi:hypothetical protein
MKTTDWFHRDIDPINEGEYEVTTQYWPWPHRVQWTKEKKWDSELPIEQWRGLLNTDITK